MSPTNKKLFRRDTHISSLRKQGSLTGMHVTLHVSPTYEPYIWALHMSRTYCSCPTHESYKHSTLYTWTLPTPHAQHMSPTNMTLFAGIHTGSTYQSYRNRALSQGCTSYYIWALQTWRSLRKNPPQNRIVFTCTRVSAAIFLNHYGDGQRHVYRSI